MDATNGNTIVVGISLFRAGKVDNFGIGDLFAAVVRNVLVANVLEGVGAFYTLTSVRGVGTDALLEVTKFVGV